MLDELISLLRVHSSSLKHCHMIGNDNNSPLTAVPFFVL